MEQLKSMKSTLMACAQGQMTNLQNVDAKELGEVVDMIKDLEEAIYYCTIVKAMEESDKEPKYYTQPYYRDMDRDMGRMYYSGNGSDNSSMSRGGSSKNYTESYPMTVRDYREGKSYINRKNYMEGKELNHDKNIQMRELESYMQELSRDISEMIEGASPEEKQLLQQKLVFLSNKIK